MIIEVDNSFKRDFKKIKNLEIEKRIVSKIEILEKSENLVDLSSVKKMHGFPNFYRIRIGDYRIGFKIVGNRIILLRVRNRKDIYNIFP